MDATTCGICSATVLDEDGKSTFPRGHVYHEMCMQAYSNVDRCLRSCPDCKKTGCELSPTAPEELSDAKGSETADSDSANAPPMCATVVESELAVVSCESSRPAAVLVATHVPTNACELTVFCSGCGSQVVPAKCRLRSKAQGTFCCFHCNSKMSTPSRGLGQWPTHEFKGLPEPEQMAFMRALDHGAGGVCARAKELLAKHSTKETFFEFGGEFLPLGVWRTRGYDSDAIEQKSEDSDKQTHPILGTVYRVRVMKSGIRGTDGMTRTSQLTGGKKKLKLQNEPATEHAAPVTVAAAAAAAEEVDPGSDDDTSESEIVSSDSDSNSSSSNRRKKSNKSKKGKKDKNKGQRAKNDKKKKKKGKTNKNDSKKERAKAKADQARSAKQEADKAAKVADAHKKALHTLAQHIVTKATPQLSMLCTTMSKPQFPHLPPFIKDAACDHQAALHQLVLAAQKVVASPGDGSLPVATIKDVTKIVMEVKKHDAIMLAMMVSIQKAQ